MIHPHIRIEHVNDKMGYGVFATQFIPKGTIVYAKDCLEIEIKEKDFKKYEPALKEQIEKYSYTDERGIRVISWDLGKYVNHCCDSNTLSTSYGFDIAVRDINEGDEMTCDYAMLNVLDEMTLLCDRPGCRGTLRPSDFESCYSKWDEKIKPALINFFSVKQPLISFVGQEKINEVSAFLESTKKYKSVSALRYLKAVPNPA
jgi:uncharacterized protein